MKNQSLYSKLLEQIILPIGEMFLSMEFIRTIKKYRQFDTYTEKELEKLQLSRLKELLLHATKNSVLYSNIQFEGEDVKEWIKKFPILTKEILRTQKERILAKRDFSKLKEFKSSGSSGFQSSVFMNKKEISHMRGAEVHWWGWSGYHLGDPLLQTGMSLNRGFIKKLKDIFFRTTYISAFTNSENEFKDILSKINGTNKKFVLVGYASSIYVISEIAKNAHYKIQLKAAISLGDKMFSHYRTCIEKTFNCKVFETYGCSEGMKIAAQKDLDYLYIMSPNVFLEIVDHAGNEVPDGELGHVLVTNLLAKDFPLIRYKLGDLAIKLPRNQYPVTRELNYPILQSVVGRDTDLVKNKMGKIMIVHSFTGIIEHYQDIKQFCVIQNYIEGITIEYIPEEDFAPEVLLDIKNKICSEMGNNFFVDFQKVNSIAPTKSGKPQIIINNIIKNEK
jgi:phenylacetate-CoA ligase